MPSTSSARNENWSDIREIEQIPTVSMKVTFAKAKVYSSASSSSSRNRRCRIIKQMHNYSKSPRQQQKLYKIKSHNTQQKWKRAKRKVIHLKQVVKILKTTDKISSKILENTFYLVFLLHS